MSSNYERQVDEPSPPVCNNNRAMDDLPDVMVSKSTDSCWVRRTTLEKVLLVIVLILVLIIIILTMLDLFMGLGHNEHNSCPQTDQYCLTPSCVKAASFVINNMNTTADPCDDFYEYACGGWVKTNLLPRGEERWGTFSVLAKKNQIVLKNAVEMPAESFINKAERKAKDYYTSCMDVNKTVDTLGNEPIMKLLQEIGGGLANNTDTDFNATISSIMRFGISVLFSFGVGTDEKNVTRNILQVDQGGLSLPGRSYYINKTMDDKVISAYYQYISQVATNIGLDNSSAHDMATKVIEFETSLANITVPREQRRDAEKMYHMSTVAAVQGMMPFLDVLGVLNNVSSLVGFTIVESQEVVVYSPVYLAQMSQIVTDLLSTSEGILTLRYYLYWRFVKSFTFYLSTPFMNARKIYNKALTGTTGPEDRWRVCISDTGGTVGYAFGAMFVRAAFQTGSKGKAEKMISEIKMAFKNNLPNLAWMDADTRIKAMDKANAIIDMIGYPQFVLNSTQLEDHYKELVIDSGTYFWNAVRSYKWSKKVAMKKLLTKPDRRKWEMTPQTVNAYYEPTKNEIVFPAGILQAPFYDQNYPKSLNFGAMGVVMGHELTHGFDDQGREYDKYGNLRPWWKTSIINNFKKKAQCIIDQYSNYSINGHHINGKNTLGENIADNGGLKSAYNAYIEWVKQNGAELKLPGTSLTHQQLFFLGFSQVWCSTQTDEYTKLLIKTNPHSPAKYRVIGTLSNSKEFAENFHCSPRSRMNPQNKCVVW